MCCAQYAIAWLSCKWTLGPNHFGVVHIPIFRIEPRPFGVTVEGVLWRSRIQKTLWIS
jgi:hypothetical protein